MVAGFERLEGGDGADYRILRRTIRATAAVSLSEVEWIRRMRATGTVLQPRVSVVDGYVVGYIAQWRDARSARLGPAITDLEVGAGLSLFDLREGWQPEVEVTPDVQTEWKLPRSIAPSVRETVLSADAALWAHALADARRFNETLTRIPSNERWAWGWAASRVGGLLAIWSSRIEPDAGGGPFAVAAHEVGMSALVAGSRVCPSMFRPPAPDLNQACFILTQLCREVHDPHTEFELVGELITSVVAMVRAHRERREMARASRIYTTAVDALESVRHDIRAVPRTSVIGCQLRLRHASRPLPR